MTYKRYSLQFTFMNGDLENYECTDYRRKDGVDEIYYSPGQRVVMDYARPDFEIPVVNVKHLMKDDIHPDDR